MLMASNVSAAETSTKQGESSTLKKLVFKGIPTVTPSAAYLATQ